MAIFLSLGVGVASSAWFLARRHDASMARAQAAWVAEIQVLKAENDRLAADLAQARAASPAEVAVAGSGPAVGASPAQILERLRAIRFGAGSSRGEVTGQIIHLTRSLAEFGPEAVPVIRGFLQRMEDVDYGDGGENSKAGGSSITVRPTRPMLDFAFPPSLRLALVDVLRTIGGEASEAVLAEMLQTSGRAVEVAYVTRTLEALAPGHYRETALTVARDLLANPPPVGPPNRLDDNARSYLLWILIDYGDATFGPTAQTLLVKSDGTVDPSVLNYLNAAMKDEAVAAIYRAYHDARITNEWEKAGLVTAAFGHVGANAQADQLFREVIGDETLPEALRSLAINSLVGGGRGATAAEEPHDPALLQSRIDLLQATKVSPSDEWMRRALERTLERLIRLRDGSDGRVQPVDLGELPDPPE
ncbi:MAG: hypothetical protein ACYC23_14470 [Limisphaerales bacterium]